MVVSEEQIETLVYSDSGLTVKPENRRYFPTIDGLFDVVETVLKDGADDLEVRWHEDLGYPKTINIDYIQNAIDDEVSFSVLRFEAGP